MTASRSDALVLFGVTGDLAHKMIFPALYAMVKRGSLRVPVIGVALPKWSLGRLHQRVTDSIERSGGIDNQPALRQLLSFFRYVSGDHEYPLFPLRQFIPGADLEPQLCGQRPDNLIANRPPSATRTRPWTTSTSP